MLATHPSPFEGYDKLRPDAEGKSGDARARSLCARHRPRARRGRGSRPLAADRHDHAAARLLPGRDDRPEAQSLLRRRLRRPLPHRRGVHGDRPQRRRDPARGAPGRGLQPHRRHRVGPPRGRADPAAARVLRPRRPERREPVPARLDRRRRSRDAAVALLRQARPGRDPEGDVERGVARRQAAVDVERAGPARLLDRRDHAHRGRARAHADPRHAAAEGRVAAERHHRRDVHRRADVRRRPGRRPVPRLLDRPRHGHAPARDRAPDRGGVRRARHRVGQGRDAELADPALQRGAAPTHLRRRPRDAAELPPGRRRTGRGRPSHAVRAAAAPRPRHRPAPGRLCRGRALPRGLHRAPDRHARPPRARARDQARAREPPLGARARPADAARAARAAHPSRAPAAHAAGRAARALGRADPAPRPDPPAASGPPRWSG